MSRPPIAPYLTVTPAVAAISWYVQAFGAKQRAYMPSPDGLRVAHCELAVNEGSVMLADPFPELASTRPPLPAEPVTMSVSVEWPSAAHLDEVFERAQKLGAKPETNPTDSFWGTRFAVLRDPFGHRWIMNAPKRARA